jgi:hypothetical protein
VSPGAKINSGRCENIGGSAIFGISRQAHLNNAPIYASGLREICDLHEMIVRHFDYNNRVGAGDDLAFERIGEDNCCSRKKKRSDQKSHGKRPHDSNR